MEVYETSPEHIRIHHARIVGYAKTEKNAANVRGEIMVKVTGKAPLTIAE